MTALSAILRVLVMLALFAALLLPSCARRTGKSATLVAVDVSASVSPDELRLRLAELNELTARRDDIHVAAFADRLVEVASVAELSRLPVVDEHTPPAVRASQPGALDRNRTDLEQALRAAAALLPNNRVGRLVVLSDGAQTHGDFTQALPTLVARNVPVYPLVLAAAPSPARIAALEVYGTPRAGGSNAARIVLSSAAPAEMAVEVQIDGETVREESVAPGEDQLELVLPFVSPGERALTMRVDGRTVLRRTIEVAAPYRIVFVSGIGEISPLPEALRQSGMVVELIAPSGLVRGEPWRGSDVLVLGGVEAKEVPTPVQTKIAAWIEAGGALLFAAGERTYGKDEDRPGWSDTPIEEVLPARFRVQEERRDVALMVALDKSYSMKGEKMTLAKEATKAALEELADEHLFGVVAFDWNSFDAVPLQPATARAPISDLIAKIEASAQTNFYPALESCLRQLQGAEAKIKHVILISDGKTYPDDYETLVGRMRSERITVSTIAVGSEADRELLEQIAKWGEGQSYFVEDAANVKRVLLQETRKKTDDTLVEEETAVKVSRWDPALGDLDIADVPTLRGFVSFEPRDGEPVLLATPDDRPLLMSRRVGLGSTWLLATDLGWRWSSRWVAWPGFVPLLSQVLRRAADSPFAQPTALTATVHGAEIELRADVRDEQGGFRNGAVVEVAVSGAQSSLLRLRQTAPGRYAARLGFAPDASSDLRFELRVDGQERDSASVYAPLPAEFLSQTDPAALARLAEATQGATIQDIAAAFVDRGMTAPTRVALRPWLLAIGLLLYLLDLFVHRTGWAERRADSEAG